MFGSKRAQPAVAAGTPNQLTVELRKDKRGNWNADCKAFALTAQSPSAQNAVDMLRGLIKLYHDRSGTGPIDRSMQLVVVNKELGTRRVVPLFGT